MLVIYFNTPVSRYKLGKVLSVISPLQDLQQWMWNNCRITFEVKMGWCNFGSHFMVNHKPKQTVSQFKCLYTCKGELETTNYILKHSLSMSFIAHFSNVGTSVNIHFSLTRLLFKFSLIPAKEKQRTSYL
jgi:hypothetical protein